ncbi:MAG TPA: MDR family MFS transporter [Stellaceae bacterium]|nr:MDR family MFS transporter [Stellaceae bacterium]
MTRPRRRQYLRALHPLDPSMPLAPAEIRVVIIGAMLALFLSALDQTIVATALPPIARDLGDFALISWVITAYLLTSTCVTPIIGKLSDLYGRRQTLRVCLLLFMAGSALCALAPSMVALILARALQGLGGGGLITLAQTIVADVVSPRERGRYSAYFSVVWASSSVLGPTMGGVMTEAYGWPWIFWINLPLGLLALLVSDRALRKLPVGRHRAPIDYASVLILTGATVALLLVLSLGGKRLAWTAPATLALAAAALLLGALFAWLQRRSAEPILPPHFLADRVIRPVLGSSFIVYGSYLAIAVLAPIYFQVALGVRVDEAGLLMIPLMLSSTVTANVAGRWSRRSGRYKRPPLLGLPVTVATMAVIALLAQRWSAPAASIALMLAGFGLGPFFPCSTVAAQNAVERGDLGAVSGAIAFSRALGGAIAIAAASALVLGLAAHALPGGNKLASIEDLTRQALPPEARAAVAGAFGIMFGAATALLALGLAVFARVEDRMLRDRPAMAEVPAD